MHNYVALAKNMQHWRNTCSIGETYSALAGHIEISMFFYICLTTVVKTEAESLDHHQVPRLHTKSTPGGAEVETGTGQRH